MDINTTPQINLATKPPRINVAEPLMMGQLLKEDRERTRKREGWYASDLGGCPSGIYYDRLDERKEENDLKTLLTFEYGHQVHRGIENLIERSGYLVGKEDDLHVVNKLLGASGRADMLLKVEDYHFLYDIKTIHEFAFRWLDKDGQAKYHHQQQIHFYYDELKKKYDNLHMIVLYAPKGNQAGNIREMYVPYQPKISRENTQFFKTLQKAWETKTPPEPAPNIIFDEDKGQWVVNWVAKYCNYHKLCTGNENWLKEAEAEAKEQNRVID